MMNRAKKEKIGNRSFLPSAKNSPLFLKKSFSKFEQQQQQQQQLKFSS
jgi:hypothetical protein